MADEPDFDDFGLDDDDDTEDTPSLPMVCATIADGEVTLNGWRPSLLRAGPARAILRAVADEGACLADLMIEHGSRGREVVVSPVANHQLDGTARAALVCWAAGTGHSRIWLGDEVVDLPGEVPAEAHAEVRCPTCHAVWEDGSPEFWHAVQRYGYFPGLCHACGGSLPEWHVTAEGPAAGDPGPQARPHAAPDVEEVER